jgi:hypothetical protein
MSLIFHRAVFLPVPASHCLLSVARVVRLTDKEITRIVAIKQLSKSDFIEQVTRLRHTQQEFVPEHFQTL